MVRGTAGGWCVVKNDFTHQYAIALPNGEHLQTLRQTAAGMGVELLGVVVQRVCSPFFVTDPGPALVAELEAWLDEGGDQ